ncbi:hypothetical protein [Priestia megaterium]|uniref:hypothetical protein n=1 Tax=Priestia megaterium TaxID=1404 RepID=UPI0016498999|nr:hypothetical protein [Priestia megaterium]
MKRVGGSGFGLFKWNKLIVFWCIVSVAICRMVVVSMVLLCFNVEERLKSELKES